jgi:hypothetical protein
VRLFKVLCFKALALNILAPCTESLLLCRNDHFVFSASTDFQDDTGYVPSRRTTFLKAGEKLKPPSQYDNDAQVHMPSSCLDDGHTLPEPHCPCPEGTPAGSLELGRAGACTPAPQWRAGYPRNITQGRSRAASA